jgi:hypothetical protein
MLDRTQWQMNLERHDELINIAHANRLAKQPKAKKQQARNSLLVNVGDILVSFGLKLKALSQSATN